MDRPFILLAATPTTYAAELYGDLIFNGPMGGRAERFRAAVEAAEAHCQRYGKTARLVSEGYAGVLDRRRLMFTCDVPR